MKEKQEVPKLPDQEVHVTSKIATREERLEASKQSLLELIETNKFQLEIYNAQLKFCKRECRMEFSRSKFSKVLLTTLWVFAASAIPK